MALPTEPKDPTDKGRKFHEVSDDLKEQYALDDGQDQDDPANAEPEVPEPKAKTPQEMKEDPEALVPDKDVTSD